MGVSQAAEWVISMDCEVTNMKFIREIPAEKIQNRDLDLEQQGFTLVWKEDSVEIWVDVVELPKVA